MSVIGVKIVFKMPVLFGEYISQLIYKYKYVDLFVNAATYL